MLMLPQQLLLVVAATLSAGASTLGNADSYKVTSLPGESADLTASLNGQYAGYIPVNDDGSLFFWYFPSPKPSTKLVIWLNGGPGCSSLIGSFEENGPVKIMDNGTLTANPESWHKQANLLYIEQPVGVGFSFYKTAPVAYNEFNIASDFVSFLNGFYTVFPETKPYQLYVTGESYAGVYIPYIAQGILQAKTLNDGTFINFGGIAIGNGLISSGQGTYSEDIQYLTEMNFFRGNATGLQYLVSLGNNCTAMELDPNFDPQNYTFQCDDYQLINDYATRVLGKDCISIYNIEASCHYTDAKDTALASFCSNTDVRTALHVDPIEVQQTGSAAKWQECSDAVGHSVRKGDRSKSVHDTTDIIPSIVEAGVPVVLYDGNLDFILHYVGYEQAINAMTWNGAMGFKSANPSNFSSAVNATAGLKWSARGLTYIRVFGCGHFVPLDQPASGSAVLAELLGTKSNYSATVAYQPPVTGAPAPLPASANVASMSDRSSMIILNILVFVSMFVVFL